MYSVGIAIAIDICIAIAIAITIGVGIGIAIGIAIGICITDLHQNSKLYENQTVFLSSILAFELFFLLSFI